MPDQWVSVKCNRFAPNGPLARLYVAGELVGRAVLREGKYIIKTELERFKGRDLLEIVNIGDYPYFETGFRG